MSDRKPHVPLPARQADEIIQKHFKMQVDDIGKLDEHLKQFIGLPVKVMSGERVYIDHIVGNKFKPQRYVINGRYDIVILEFYRQMLKDRSITDEDVALFDQMEHSVEELTPIQKAGLLDPSKSSILDYKKRILN